MAVVRCLAALALVLLQGSLATNPEGLKFLEEKAKEEGVVKLASGLLYKVLKTGEGKHHPTKDSPCDCHYKGTLIDGAEFDSSYSRGKPTTFAPAQVIKGWTEAMQLMVEGDKWEMYIPSELGYGDGGSGEKIKGGDVLVFRMEILKILGGKKRATKCDVMSKEGCEPDEIAILEEWSGKSVADLGKEVELLAKRLEETMKAGMREPMVAKQKVLKQLHKAMQRKGGEL
mmetsp:Transcript_34370/g.91043  ORF Transcript_34370/g.91043 Transcript_34370/m.91043 type:complete len:229 (+) Transcript_34370:56-742(+)